MWCIFCNRIQFFLYRPESNLCVPRTISWPFVLQGNKKIKILNPPTFLVSRERWGCTYSTYRSNRYHHAKQLMISKYYSYDLLADKLHTLNTQTQNTPHDATAALRLCRHFWSQPPPAAFGCCRRTARHPPAPSSRAASSRLYRPQPQLLVLVSVNHHCRQRCRPASNLSLRKWRPPHLLQSVIKLKRYVHIFNNHFLIGTLTLTTHLCRLHAPLQQRFWSKMRIISDRL